MSGPGFADPSWFDPQPGKAGVLGMTLEQLARQIRLSTRAKRLVCGDANAALAEILRRIDAATGNT